MANGHGGARDGAGPLRADDPRQAYRAEIDEWKARSEKAKALALERENEVAEGNLIDRALVAAAAATAMATCAQAGRSIPDQLERALGLPPEIVERIAVGLDEAFSNLANELQALADLGKR